MGFWLIYYCHIDFFAKFTCIWGFFIGSLEFSADSYYYKKINKKGSTIIVVNFIKEKVNPLVVQADPTKQKMNLLLIQTDLKK